MAVIGECGSAKEVVMAVQEAVEQLERLLDSEDQQSDDNKGECISLMGTSKLSSPITRLTILIDLYGTCKFWIGWSVYAS